MTWASPVESCLTGMLNSFSPDFFSCREEIFDGLPDFARGGRCGASVSSPRAPSCWVNLIHGAQGYRVQMHERMIADNINSVERSKICIESFLDRQLNARSKSQVMISWERGQNPAACRFSPTGRCAFEPRAQEYIGEADVFLQPKACSILSVPLLWRRGFSGTPFSATVKKIAEEEGSVWPKRF